MIGGVVTEGLKVGGVGLTIGTLAANQMGGLLEAFLFGIRPLDALTYVGVAGLVILACVVGSYLPARSISSVDVARVLRPD